jgi:hypothetical protein
VRHVTAPGYEFIPDLGEYKLHNELRLWHEARDICQKEDAHLAIINSKREAEAFSDLWKRHIDIPDDWSYDAAHVGFHRHNAEGHYVTVLGKFPFLFTLCVQ